MKALHAIVALMILSAAVSCANSFTQASRSEYWKGYDTAEAFAKKDAVNSLCSDYPRIGRSIGPPGSFDAMRQTQKYTKTFQEQGRSASFIKGFQFGYEESYYQFLELYCGW